jgi:hypothetical protein
MTKDKKITSRAAETRTKTERPKEYKPPSSLDAPPAPDGFSRNLRWYKEVNFISRDNNQFPIIDLN